MNEVRYTLYIQNSSDNLGIESMRDIVTDYDPFGDKLANKIVTGQKQFTGMIDNHFFTKTFCILPWIHSLVKRNGEIKLCCYTIHVLKESNGKTPLNLQHKSLREIWNSSALKEIRHKMMAGEKLEECINCDNEREKGQISKREFYNNAWLVYDDECDKWIQRVQDSMDDDFNVNSLPVYYTLLPGNLCNLKCRMCSPSYSSAILHDSVQNNWDWLNDIDEETDRNNLKWFESDSIIEQLLEEIQEKRMFHLIGGEPLLNPTINNFIDILIKRGAAHKISLEFSTNLTVFREDFFSKLTHFKSVLLMLSIDGVGQVFEYIRYPAKWSEILNNLKTICRYHGFSIRITATIQNYNVLHITDLLEFIESFNLSTNLNILQGPEYLNIRVMPKKARILAAKRLKEYADRSPMVKRDKCMASTISNVVLELEQDTEKPYRDYIRKFMVFTNDMDKSRNQSFKSTFPELYNFIIEDDFIWTDEVLYWCCKNG